MKTRIIVHIALNAKGERCGSMVEVCGRLIPFGGHVFSTWKYQSATQWIDLKFTTLESIAFWKKYSKRNGAVRFQRVTVLGEANELNKSKLQRMVSRRSR